MNIRTETRPELTIKRSFDASRDLVFRCWTEPERLNRWCCPKGFSLPFSEGDVRPGGSFKTCMRAPDGTDHWLSGTYQEIVPPERLVFSHRWLNEEGEHEHETVVTITLREQDGKTLLTLHQAFFLSEASRDGHREGWNETLDNLAEYLAK
ncbi:SRPBCC domain-containing protein [Mesorhizobium sp. LHD-90]|uniref:SRPBCC family protein n=1 Tax=Mesorhizobium sp. LHD-90 TaxID=3071414 RepID=UPI0027DFD420|nr:SRPBCC domain-containing protein [Mesorhizobium sp. LHD-90]MDQ6436193.1 SRPBCC domain-containing protein [Mesorhizobium sp. LHD-90]